MANARAALLPPARARLAKILGLLGSNHDGEVAAAGRRADALVKAAGLTWPDLLGVDVARKEFDARHYEMVNCCLARAEIFTERELKFLRSIRQWVQRGRALSEKQAAWLVVLHDHAEEAP